MSEEKNQELIQGNNNSFCSAIWFSYLNKLLSLHVHKDLKLENLYKVDQQDTYKSVSNNFNEYLKKKSKSRFYWKFVSYVKKILI